MTPLLDYRKFGAYNCSTCSAMSIEGLQIIQIRDIFEYPKSLNRCHDRIPRSIYYLNTYLQSVVRKLTNIYSLYTVRTNIRILAPVPCTIICTRAHVVVCVSYAHTYIYMHNMYAYMFL